MNKGSTIWELFVELANPDKNGVSRWVNVSEFTGKYVKLRIKNGLSWGRTGSTIARKFNIQTDRTLTPGNSIDAIRLNGFNKQTYFNQYIRQDIKDYYKSRKCVMLGIRGNSENTKIEIDHKDGRKNSPKVSDSTTQTIDDFQPLCKAANDAKRQICKECIKTNIRWDAKNLQGNPYSYYKGDEKYSEKLGCIGCYQYDPVEYRKTVIKMIAEEASKYTAEFVMNKIYGENK